MRLIARRRSVALAKARRPSSLTRGSHVTTLLIMGLLLLIIFLSSSFILDAGSARSIDLGVVGTFLLNGLLACSLLAHEMRRAPFSLGQVHWIFYLCFFVLAPLSQYLYGYWCWDFVLPVSLLMETNTLLFLWGAMFALLSCLGRTSTECRAADSLKGGPIVSDRCAGLMVILSVAATVILAGLVGFDGLFSRSTYSLGLNQTMELVIDKVLRGIPVFTVVFIWRRHQQRDGGVGLLMVSLACLFVADFPMGMARYNAAVIYGGLLLLIWRPLYERRGLFAFLFLLAFLIVFPASNVFRREEFDAALLVSKIVDVVANLPRGFCAGDYDAYSMLARSIIYVRDFGPEMGHQLLSAALFFVPRTLWPAKSIGSGSTVAESQAQLYTNLSCPFPAEGFINFGVFGLLLFAIILGLVCRCLDNWFYKGAGGMRLFYPFGCMFFFFILRGDLLSSWAYFVGYLVVFTAMLGLAKKTEKRLGKMS